MGSRLAKVDLGRKVETKEGSLVDEASMIRSCHQHVNDNAKTSSQKH